MKNFSKIMDEVTDHINTDHIKALRAKQHSDSQSIADKLVGLVHWRLSPLLCLAVAKVDIEEVSLFILTNYIFPGHIKKEKLCLCQHNVPSPHLWDGVEVDIVERVFAATS